MNPDFQIGDRVRIVRPEGGVSELVGMTGTVCALQNNSHTVGVEHDGMSEYFHNCLGVCEYGRGFWYFDPDQQIEKIGTVDVQIDTIDDLI